MEDKLKNTIIDIIATTFVIVGTAIKISLMIGIIYCLLTWRFDITYFGYSFLGAIVGGLIIAMIKEFTHKEEEE